MKSPRVKGYRERDEERCVTSLMLTALLLVLAITPLGVAAVVARRSWRADAVAAVALTVGAVPWLRLSKPIEGRVLWTVTPSHGLCEADLVAAPVGILAATLGIRAGLVLLAALRVSSASRRSYASASTSAVTTTMVRLSAAR